MLISIKKKNNKLFMALKIEFGEKDKAPKREKLLK
jgi:hypothetical protein